MSLQFKNPPKNNPLIAQLAEEAGSQPEALLEIFRDACAAQGSLARADITQAARHLRIPASKAYGVASFYTMLNLAEAAEPARTAPPAEVLRVCDGPVCWLAGGGQLRRTAEELQAQAPGWRVERTSCLGLCDRAPAALMDDQQAGPLAAENLPEALSSGLLGTAVDYSQPRPGEVRVMLAKTGVVNPDSLVSALENDGYRGLASALRGTPEQALATIEQSGLTGRGGAGFLVGRKWRFVAQAERFPKYVICNADESEPLIFKDRVLIDSNPHQILEGMAIAGYATGASTGYIYIRGEYAAQAERLQKAISQAEAAGRLGGNIMHSGFSFHIHIHRGAGAYICGEETALIESLEGSRGEPRLRPPYPPSRGLYGLPTLVNNVESFAACPSIMRNGAEWHRTLTGYATPGTKLYMILGHVNRPGLFEAPFGITLRQAIEEFGGGLRPGSQFQFALTGGAAGTIVGEGLLDVPIDYASAAQGIALGAGAFLICDQSVSVVEFLRQLLHFFTVESCGKCTPCRAGTEKSLRLLTHMAAGDRQPDHAAELFHLANIMQIASFCGLGQSVAIPVKSALNQFPANFGMR